MLSPEAATWLVNDFIVIVNRLEGVFCDPAPTNCAVRIQPDGILMIRTYSILKLNFYIYLLIFKRQ